MPLLVLKHSDLQLQHYSRFHYSVTHYTVNSMNELQYRKRSLY